MEKTTSGKPPRPCASGCGNTTSPTGRYCQGCSERVERERKERWRRKNPTFKEMIGMSEEELAETGRRLLQLRAELKAKDAGTFDS